MAAEQVSVLGKLLKDIFNGVSRNLCRQLHTPALRGMMLKTQFMDKSALIEGMAE